MMGTGAQAGLDVFGYLIFGLLVLALWGIVFDRIYRRRPGFRRFVAWVMGTHYEGRDYDNYREDEW